MTLCEAQYCCEEPTSSPSPAICRCSSCHDMLFCGPCFTQQHQRGAYRTHKATEFPQGTTQTRQATATICALHNKERELMCSCGEPICCLCEKSKNHSGHTNIPLVDSILQKVSELKGFLMDLDDISTKEVDAISKISEEKLLVSKRLVEGNTSILVNLQAIQVAAESRCKELNDLSQAISASMTRNLEVQSNALEAVLQNLQGLMTKVKDIIEQGDPLNVIQSHSVLSAFLSEKASLLDKRRLEPCEQAKAIVFTIGPTDDVIGMIKKYGAVSKGRLPNPPSGGRAPVCTRKSDTIITVQWEPPSPHDEQMDIEQVVGYNVLVSPSSNHTASASLPETTTTTSPPSSLSPSTLKTTGGGARDGVRGPLEAVATVALFEVKGKETTKCEVTVEPKELSVAVCAVSLVGSSAPTQSAIVTTTLTREVEVFVWGAAGGGNCGNRMAGGPGGFSTARMVLKTGTRLTIVVGQGGAGNCYSTDTPRPPAPATRRSFGGGGCGGCGCSDPNDRCSGAGGGGCSAVMFDGVPLVVAGGGGGSAVSNDTHGFGGGGGGEEGGADGSREKAATQNPPGCWPGRQGGGSFRGGDGCDAAKGPGRDYGGGGGGGLYGGAGGYTFSDAKGGCGGGGGSGFVLPPTPPGCAGWCFCVAAVLSSRTVCGQRATAAYVCATPPETSNEHYCHGAGACGFPKTPDDIVDGNHGLVVVVTKGMGASGGTITHVFKFTGQNQFLLIQ